MNGDENSWASLQNGGVLAVGYQTDGAAIYDPATGKWARTATPPNGFNTGDTGGISQMFDGRVFVYGLAGQSYIYTPGATAADPGTWALGPKMLNGDEAEDEYSDTLPNGKVWGGLVTMTYGPGVVLQQFDPDDEHGVERDAAARQGQPVPDRVREPAERAGDGHVGEPELDLHARHPSEGRVASDRDVGRLQLRRQLHADRHADQRSHQRRRRRRRHDDGGELSDRLAPGRGWATSTTAARSTSAT